MYIKKITIATPSLSLRNKTRPVKSPSCTTCYHRTLHQSNYVGIMWFLFFFDLFLGERSCSSPTCFPSRPPTGDCSFSCGLPGPGAVHIQHGQPPPSLHSVMCVLIILPSAARMLLLIFLLIF